jgi:hypothetical protein
VKLRDLDVSLRYLDDEWSRLQDDQGHQQYYNEEHTGRDDGYWEEEDESSDGFEPLPHWQQELPHGERYNFVTLMCLFHILMMNGHDYVERLNNLFCFFQEFCLLLFQYYGHQIEQDTFLSCK